jgi:hypothetical protein
MLPRLTGDDDKGIPTGVKDFSKHTACGFAYFTDRCGHSVHIQICSWEANHSTSRQLSLNVFYFVGQFIYNFFRPKWKNDLEKVFGSYRFYRTIIFCIFARHCCTMS